MDPATSPGSPVPLDRIDAVQRHLATVLAPTQRERHTACGVLCDAAARPLINSTVDDCGAQPSVAECARITGVFADALVGADSHGMLLLAVTRPGAPHAVETDERWFHGLNRACAQRDVRPLGLYILTPQSMFELTLGDVL